MSLTVFVHKERPVAIVRWLFDAKGNILFACGPLIRMPWNEFRATGYDWIIKHFEEYKRIRLAEKDVVPVFKRREAAKVMKGCRIVHIGMEPSGTLVFVPKTYRKYDLAALEGVGREYRRTIPEGSSPDAFWAAFDQTLAAAPLAEPE